MRSRSLALSATLALVLLPSQLPAAALPLLRTEWNASSAALGWVVSAYMLGYAAAVLVVLPLTDRVRPSRVIAIGALITALANLAFALAAQDVITGSLLRMIAGFGLAGVYMPGVRLVAQSSDPARRGTAVGLYVAAFYLGGSLSFLATGLLLEPFGWRGTAIILGAVALAALPVATISSRGIPETTGERAPLCVGLRRHLHRLRHAALRALAGDRSHRRDLRGARRRRLRGVLDRRDGARARGADRLRTGAPSRRRIRDRVARADRRGRHARPRLRLGR